MASSTFSLTEPLIQRDPPDAVIYDLSQPTHVTITLPTRSTWTSGLHWHERHVEHLRVVRGSILLTEGSSTRIISADPKEDNEICINRRVWHEWRRAAVDTGEDVVVVERTEPEDGEKTVFFWNLNGVILTAHQGGMPCPPYMPRNIHQFLVNTWVTLSLFTIFCDLDNFPVFVNVLRAFAERGFTFWEGTLGHSLLRSVDVVVSHLVLLVVARIARMVFGIQAVRESLTPEDARRRWAEKTGAKKSGKMG